MSKSKKETQPAPADHEGKGFFALAGEAFAVLGEEIVEGKDKVVEVAAAKFTAAKKAINKITHKKTARPAKKAAARPAKKAVKKVAKKAAARPVKKAAKKAVKKAVQKAKSAPKKVAKVAKKAAKKVAKKAAGRKR
jgi:hypothetical protein